MYVPSSACPWGSVCIGEGQSQHINEALNTACGVVPLLASHLSDPGTCMAAMRGSLVLVISFIVSTL